MWQENKTYQILFFMRKTFLHKLNGFSDKQEHKRHDHFNN